MKCLMLLAVLVTVGGGSSIVKRSDDTNPLEGVVSQLSSDLLALQAKVNALSTALGLLNVRVGFMVSELHDIELNSQVVVKFDGVQYNEGNAYSTTTGFFTAPVAGMYTFFLKTEIDARNTVGLSVMKEGQRILYLYATDHDSYQTPSGQVLVHLAKGENVWVETNRDHDKVRVWTRYGGFLVHPDTTN